MLWFNIGISDFIKKRVCKFLLNRYLGNFFEEKLTVNQICLDLYNGKGSVTNVKLCCEAINSLFETQGWDFEITNGEIGSLAVDIPWNSLMSEDSVVEVNNLYICLRPQARAKDDGTTMLESMWSSMSSSMQLAQECLEKNEDPEFEVQSSSTMEGLEKFAQTIDNILIRVRVKLVDTTIRLEYLPTGSKTGVAIIVKIKSLGYQNEARNDAPDREDSEKSDQKTIVFSTHASHYITLDDISFYSEEFRIGTKKKEEAEEEGRSRHSSSNKSDDEDDDENNEEDDSEHEHNSSSLDPFASAISSFSPDNEMFYSQSAMSESEGKNRKTDETSDDDEEGEEIYRSEMVLMGCINSRQEIRLNMKLAENIDGPKVSLEVTFGSLLLFFTPRQFHMLLLICDILLNGEAASSDGDAADDAQKRLLKEKSHVEERKNLYGGNLLSHQTWSGEDYECSSETANIKGMRGFNKLRPVGSDSILSSNSSMTSSMQSSASQTTSHSNRHRRAIERDQNADISHYNIRVAGVYVILLHDDILVPETDTNALLPLNEASVETLSCRCKYFFNYSSSFINTCGTSDLVKIGAILSKACDSNHLRIMLAPIIVSGEERRTERGNRTKLNISISRAEVREMLDGLSLPIIDFSRKDTTSEISSKQPEVSISLEKTFYVLISSSGKQYIAPRLNMEIALGMDTETTFAFDISIFDRIHALFTSPFNFCSSSPEEPEAFDELSANSQRKVQSKSEIKILAENLKFILFFPIVDLRPANDPDRCPYWKRNVRPDFLQIRFKEFKLNLISSIYDIIAKEILLYYSESEKHTPIYFAKASFHENTHSKYYPASVEYPRIIVQIPTDAQLKEMNEEFVRNHRNFKDDSDSDPTSESIKIKPNLERDSTPFSRKRVCRESDTPHNKGEEDESEILLIPGDREEMKHFCDNAYKFSKLQIKLDLPIISMQLKSKHFYEVFYNRIISDILMWESSAPKPNHPAPQIVLKKPPESLMTAGMMDSIYAPFAMCKSNINFESSSSATNSESESENDPVFYSVYDSSKIKGKSMLSDVYQTDYSSAVALELSIGKGAITMYAPVRDAQNHVIPGQLGEFVIKANSTSIFSVSSYHGNTNLGYFCIQSGHLEVYHCGLLPVPIQNPPLRDMSCSLPAWLSAMIYPTPKNLSPCESRGQAKRDMLALAVQIKANPDQGLKRIKVSVGIQNATLRYFSTLSEHLWLTQLLDMFDVKEELVPGYTPSTNLTELHLHLWNSNVDYRPLRYPFRALVNIGTLMISSNLATGSVGCTLRFVAEDATLCMAPQNLGEKQAESNKITSLPSSELVCVADLGLFEISLKLNEKVTPLSPKFDLRAAIKDVNVRTCSDSGRALLEFISYLASEGDLCDESALENDDDKSETSSIMQTNDDEVLLKEPATDIPEVTETQQKHVNSLMADAMEESIYIPSTSGAHTDDSDEPIDLGSEVFFFPDEQTKKELKYGVINRKIDSCKRRCASEDSISIDSSSFREDEEVFVKRYQPKDEDSGSVNTEMRELLDFETSVMGRLKEPSEEFDPLPQVEMDLGDITKYEAVMPARSVQETKKSCSESDDDFYIVADEERPNYSDIPVAPSDDPIRIVDNHFSAPHGKPDLLKAPADFPMAVQRYTLCEMTLVWSIYGGRDFDENDRKREREEREEINRKAFTNYPMSEVYKMGVSYTKGSPSLSLGGNQNKLTWKTRGGYCRKHDVLMEIHLNKVRFSHETYPTTTEQASRQVLLISELEIRDRLAISNINKFLYHPTVGFRTRQGNNHMVVVKALHLRPERHLKTQECCLRISLLPIRLNIDQDSLLFMINFFNELSGGSDLNESKATQSTAVAKVHQPPVMMVELPEAAQELQARKMVSENLSLLLNDEAKSSKETPETTNEPPPPSDSSPIFFRQIIFSPDVQIRLDYQGKRVELSHGPLAGLLMGLGQLQCSEIRLKKISYRHGILGVDRLLNFLIHEWLQDIKKRQLPNILGGVGPMYSLVQLFQGIFDLFYLPFEQYQKDGRIVRGIQRGAQSFSARTALAALEITSRIIYLLQITAETAYDMVSPGPSVRRRVNRKGKRKRIHPPQDIREGMSNAFYIVKDGIGDTAQTIMQMAALEHDQKGYTGAVGAVMRQIPPTMVRPIVLATQASNQVLGGLTSQLIPDARIEAKEKWKDDNDN